jgi:hypothetical protein
MPEITLVPNPSIVPVFTALVARPETDCFYQKTSLDLSTSDHDITQTFTHTTLPFRPFFISIFCINIAGVFFAF